ncbi:hypothetical protein JYU34_004638 [Plutella xylostella]|uniref:Uncharacterized protein n=1 Tax=Plutella xylostella TaxID=51655 RepID=A0ABQ7QYH4_PLUXY|nr:hypothetical protein JYU34_004638 [Plutella xylostella]
MDRLQVVAGRPLRRLPCGGFQSNAILAIFPSGLLRQCPIQLHFLLRISLFMGSCRVSFQRSSLDIVSGQNTRRICRRCLLTQTCNLVEIDLVTFHVSQPYSRTDLTLLTNIRSLRSRDMMFDRHIGVSWANAPFAFLILPSTSSSVPPVGVRTLPR